MHTPTRPPRLLRPLALLLALAAAAGSGCVVAAVGAAAGYGAYEYTNGESTGVASASVDRTYHATVRTIEQLGLKIRSQSREVAEAFFRTNDAEHTQIDITIKRRSGEFTAIIVRVGVFGDEARSRTIINKIKENL